MAPYQGGDGGFFGGLGKLGTLCIMGFRYGGRNGAIEGRRTGVLAVE